ncbi:ImmA/IrrE family metallo-endopeptidase [Endozoicomonas ascidiicola]|uniref:ImmA/IrrE family metallo-endopeptidase n=1 Tax=Endozoicomonas ascidiicola TaxID=1698521 RepID=UPI0008349B95|nr:ImmA/IrrE family metallo-endopeptidase [Endozoicomonas ascidiicola]
MTTMTTPMKKLQSRLHKTGFPIAYVKSVIPEWWDKSLEASSQSMLMLKMHLSKHLGLDLPSLIDDRMNIRFQEAGRTHYRMTHGKSDSDVVIAKSLAISVAKLVAAATVVPYKPIPASPSSVRKVIHREYNWVSFEALLDYVWKRGVPVVHLKKLPAKAKKFDGMVVNIDGRPVIILSRMDKAAAWQLFILAHEVGHIGKGHTEDGIVFLDEKLSGADEDEREQEATDYGMHLISGKSDTNIRSASELNGSTLAKASLTFGRKHKVDPGHVALNYGHSMKRMGVARAALNQLPDQYNAMEHMSVVLYQNIDLDLLPDDSQDILAKLV